MTWLERLGMGEGEKSRGLAEDQGDLDEAGQRGEAPMQVPTTQDFEKFHVHAKSVRGS